MGNWITGIDLSGPGSAQHTSLARFCEVGERRRLDTLQVGADDPQILELLPRNGIAGLDAPLSYSETGGSRTGDTILRREAVAHGLLAGTLMAPSAPRMVYLTLRGVALTRMPASECRECRVVEVHPKVSMGLRGAPIAALRAMKKEAPARRPCWRGWRSRGWKA